MNKNRSNSKKYIKNPSQKLKFRNAPWKLIVLASLILVTASIVAFRYYTRPGIVVCKGSLIDDAVPFLDPNAKKDLGFLEDKILALDDYYKDVNCLYILTVYNINISNSKSAKKHYNQLVKVYRPLVGYDSRFGTEVKEPDDLKIIIDFLENSDKSAENSALYGSVK